MRPKYLSSKDVFDLKNIGHWPTLISAFLYFDISFMAWLSLGPLMFYIAQDLNIPIQDKLTLVAIPSLSGAFFRIPLGLCCDLIGSKKTGVFAQIIVIISISLVYFLGLRTENNIIIFAIILGIAGGSFAVALPQVGAWYPPSHQGLVMGIAGAGNLGVVLDTLFAPWIAEHYGWRSAYGILMIFMIIILLIYMMLARDAPKSHKSAGIKDYGRAVLDVDCRWFMFFYFITAGGFIGLSSSLPLYFTSQFHLDGVSAGLLSAFCVAFGSTFRPLGGYIADRFGGIKTLFSIFMTVSICFFIVALLPEWASVLDEFIQNSTIDILSVKYLAVAVFSAGMLCLGMGNGAVFQLLPQRFNREIGVITGVVGAAGGVGGFLLTKMLAMSKGLTDAFAGGFLLFCIFAVLGMIGLFKVNKRWRDTWGANSGAKI